MLNWCFKTLTLSLLVQAIGPLPETRYLLTLDKFKSMTSKILHICVSASSLLRVHHVLVINNKKIKTSRLILSRQINSLCKVESSKTI